MTNQVETKLKVPIIERASGFPMYVVLSAICLLGSGIIHGFWTDRWAPPTEKQEVIAIERVPSQVGEWVGEDLAPLDHPLSIQSLHRRYTNRITNRSVDVLLIGGDPGTVFNYPITRLFPGHAYRAASDPAPLNVLASHDGLEERALHAFLTADLYEPSSLKTEQLITVWGWTRSGIWESPTKPLDQFVSEKTVFRLYVTQVWDFAERSRPNDIEDFITVAVPVLSEAIDRMPEQAATDEVQP